ncbi:MAG: hypothetical protein DRQ55_08035 [Planctomycetota bacterium]|nr:MAG: hypothetical protein DRQ55_08035 [Planctomycetota bacterium]
MGQSPEAGAPHAAPRPLLRTCAFALAPLIALLLSLEAALSLLGLGAERGQPLSAGFDPHAQYLVPVDGSPGAWRTQFRGIENTHKELQIPPRDGRLRLLLFGGSNTQGFPEELMQRALNEAAPDPGYEVINLGRPGYGSERVLILFEQALALEPDVVVIYSGHNEFVESGFALELADRGATAQLLRALDRLQQVRIVNLAVTAFRPAGVPLAPPRPEARRSPGARFNQLTFVQTQVFYEAYAENLAHMCELAEAAGVRIVLSTVIGNMLFRPRDCGLPLEMSGEMQADFEQRLEWAQQLIPSRFVEAFSPSVPPRWYAWRDTGRDRPAAPDDAVGAQSYRAPRLRPLSGPLALAPAGIVKRIPIVEGAHWTDPAGWEPSLRPVIDAVAALHERELTPQEALATQRAAALFEQLLIDCDNHPVATFNLALCTYLLGHNDEGATQLLIDAACFDRTPRRGNQTSNDIVRELAARYDLTLLDAEALYRARCPDGIIGWEVMLDVCHIHPGARVALMHDIARAVLTP